MIMIFSSIFSSKWYIWWCMTNFLYPIHFYTTYWQLWQPFWTPQASRVLGTAWDLKGAAEKGAASNDGTLWTTGIVSRTLGAYQWGVRSPENRVTASDLRVVSKPNSISNLLFKSVLFLGFLFFLSKKIYHMMIIAKFFPANLPSERQVSHQPICALATGVNATQFRVLRPTKLRECLGPCRSSTETPSYGWRVGRERGNLGQEWEDWYGISPKPNLIQTRKLVVCI